MRPPPRVFPPKDTVFGTVDIGVSVTDMLLSRIVLQQLRQNRMTYI